MVSFSVESVGLDHASRVLGVSPNKALLRGLGNAEECRGHILFQLSRNTRKDLVSFSLTSESPN